MVTVALDTTTRAGSVAVWRHNRVVVSHAGDPQRTHGERLPADLLEALAEAGVSPAEVDRFGVCSGPGSFTGLRVGLATVQGLALACARPVVPVPTLEALAYAGLWSEAEPPVTGSVVAWMNAQRGEVFGAVYRVREGRLEAAGAPRVGVANVVAAGLAPAVDADAVLLVRDDVSTAASELGAAVRGPVAIARAPLRLAEAVVRLTAETGSERAIPPHGIRPVYVRPSDAEIARDRRMRSAGDASG